MARSLALAILLFTLCGPLLADAAHAQVGPPAYAPYPEQQYGLVTTRTWTADDEAWFRQNRAFAMAGKIMTVSGILMSLAVALPLESWAAFGVGMTLQYSGQFMWAGAELRGAKQMRRRGYKVSKVPGIIAVAGSVLSSPILWIAGPIQSARLRRAHDEITHTYTGGGPTLSTFGLGARLQF
jgi:hypothetical protein